MLHSPRRLCQNTSGRATIENISNVLQKAYGGVYNGDGTLRETLALFLDGMKEADSGRVFMPQFLDAVKIEDAPKQDLTVIEVNLF